MKTYASLGRLLLGIWLIATGIMGIFGIAFQILTLAADILAIATGVILLIGLRRGNWIDRLAIIFLAAWLILVGLMPLVGMGLPFSSEIVIILAILAGIFLLIGLRGAKAFGRIGQILLAIWLIATAAVPMLNLDLPGAGIVLAILGIVAGVFIIIDR